MRKNQGQNVPKPEKILKITGELNIICAKLAEKPLPICVYKRATKITKQLQEEIRFWQWVQNNHANFLTPTHRQLLEVIWGYEPSRKASGENYSTLDIIHNLISKDEPFERRKCCFSHSAINPFHKNCIIKLCEKPRQVTIFSTGESLKIVHYKKQFTSLKEYYSQFIPNAFTHMIYFEWDESGEFNFTFLAFPNSTITPISRDSHPLILA